MAGWASDKGWRAFFRGWVEQLRLWAREICHGLRALALDLFTPPLGSQM